MDRVFRYLRVQSDVLDRESGVVLSVVRPVSYRPGAGYCWKYRVPMNELPQLLLSRTDVPNTGSGMVLLGRHRAGELGCWAAFGSYRRALRNACLNCKWRAAAGVRGQPLLAPRLPVPPRAIEPFPSKGRAIARRGPGGVDGRLKILRVRRPRRRSALAAVQERSVPRPRCATGLGGADA